MGLLDLFNVKYIKEENDRLHKLMTPEMQNSLAMQNHISQLQKEIDSLTKQLSDKQSELDKQTQAIAETKAKLISFQEDVLVQDFGLYHPTFEFMHSDEYKLELLNIREYEKYLIRNNFATTASPNWTINGSRRTGQKMVRDMQKLLLRAFNSECDDIISKVKYNNIIPSGKRITASCNAISKLGAVMGVAITKQYYDCKIKELELSYEYQQIKQKEKEEQREARARLREEAKLQKEIEEQRRKVEKEQNHYQNALSTLLKQINTTGETPELLAKKSELEKQLGEIEHTMKDLDYREANQKAGYVYIISNIGAFGENMYKIGMTRRLDPQERVDELGDASVPFNFDVHAMIFSDNAPALENALHKAFADRKVNLVNHRREFFYATLDEIKAVVRENYDKTVEFIDIPDAEQYRTSIKKRQQGIFD